MIFYKLLCLTNLAIAFQSAEAARFGTGQSGNLNLERGSNVVAKLESKFEHLTNDIKYEPNHIIWNIKSDRELEDFFGVIPQGIYKETQLVWYLLNWYQRTKGIDFATEEQTVTINYNNIKSDFRIGTNQVDCDLQLCIDPFSEEDQGNIQLLKSIQKSYGKYFEEFKGQSENYPFDRVPKVLIEISKDKSIDEAGKELDVYIRYYLRIKADSERVNNEIHPTKNNSFEEDKASLDVSDQIYDENELHSRVQRDNQHDMPYHYNKKNNQQLVDEGSSNQLQEITETNVVTNSSPSKIQTSTDSDGEFIEDDDDELYNDFDGELVDDKDEVEDDDE